MKKDANKEFVRIYDRYIEKIYRFVYIKVSSQEIAEDITSEVFLKVWKVYQKQKSATIRNPGSFLYKTAKNLLADYYRKRSRTMVTSIEDQKELPDPNQDIDKKEATKEDLEKISKALQELKDEYQDVIIWYYVEDLSIPEIAKILNKSENAVRVMIHRAMTKLKETLNSKL